jgi:hypothetical protein
MLKKTTKNIFGQTFSKLEYPLIVNSYGRSGSTVLTESIIESCNTAKISTLRKLVDRSIDRSSWNLNGIQHKNGFVYKTHDYPPSSYINKNVKMLYTFAEPVDVVLSLLRLFDERGENWIKLHYEHLGVSYYNSFDQIIYEDQLRLEKHLEAWLNETRIPIAFIRYENMWNKQTEISEFLGFEMQLPKFIERKANRADKEIKLKILNNYKSFSKKIRGLEDFFIINQE